MPRNTQAACLESKQNTQFHITGNRATRTKEISCLGHGTHFRSVVGMNPGTGAGRMSLGGVNMTKHDTKSTMWGSCNDTPPSKCFIIYDVSTSVCIDGPSSEIIASFTCYGKRASGRCGYLVLGFGRRKICPRNCRQVSCESCRLICVSIGRSDSRRKADSSFHTITKMPRIPDSSTVLMRGINQFVNDAHYRDAILEASQKHLSDQIMEKMVSPWMHRSLSPKKFKHIVQTRALVVMREKE